MKPQSHMRTYSLKKIFSTVVLNVENKRKPSVKYFQFIEGLAKLGEVPKKMPLPTFFNKSQGINMKANKVKIILCSSSGEGIPHEGSTL